MRSIAQQTIPICVYVYWGGGIAEEVGWVVLAGVLERGGGCLGKDREQLWPIFSSLLSVILLSSLSLLHFSMSLELYRVKLQTPCGFAESLPPAENSLKSPGRAGQNHKHTFPLAYGCEYSFNRLVSGFSTPLNSFWVILVKAIVCYNCQIVRIFHSNWKHTHTY